MYPSLKICECSYSYTVVSFAIKVIAFFTSKWKGLLICYRPGADSGFSERGV